MKLILLSLPKLPVAALAQALGGGLGVVLGIGFVAACACLVAAALGGFGERSVSGIKVSLVLAIVCALAYMIVQALFTAGGITENITPTAVN
ncbi:MAG: hypothetical protein JO279_18385 [Verrucomicrobia bacterium]|nr:hypothetical protein [Verrucomicrobiota bacterium]MBV8378965.1 hypothetical protein [Verrucomicrobiota bacterium]